jgi:hypothetical protein
MRHRQVYPPQEAVTTWYKLQKALTPEQLQKKRQNDLEAKRCEFILL